MKKKVEKKYPIRTCIACRKKVRKRDMIRIVKTREDEILVDKDGKTKGRGANFCADIDCFQKAAKKHLIEKALDLDRKLTDDESTAILSDFKAVLYEREFRKGKKNLTFRIQKEDLERIIINNDKTNTKKEN